MNLFMAWKHTSLLRTSLNVSSRHVLKPARAQYALLGEYSQRKWRQHQIIYMYERGPNSFSLNVEMALLVFVNPVL